MDSLKSFLIFITAVLLVYGGTNFYIYRRIMQAVGLTGWWYWALKIVILLFIAAFPLGRIIGGEKALGVPFVWGGAFWLGAMAYMLMAVLLVDVIRLGDLIFGYFPKWVVNNRLLASRITFVVFFTAIISLVLFGYVHSLKPQVKSVSVNFKGGGSNSYKYTVALLADIHLGTIVGQSRLEKIIQQTNELKPDLVVIAGDLFDEHPHHIPWVGETLEELHAPKGVYYATGNHEFYSDVEQCVKVASEAGFVVLRDAAVVIDSSFVLAAFDDQTGARQFGQRRVPLSEIIPEDNSHLPIVLMHHTPTRIDECAENGVDLVLCGHTHGGQLWPFGAITKLVYKLPQGLTWRGNTSVYVSNGTGTWGPPMRIGATPEITLFHIANEN